MIKYLTKLLNLLTCSAQSSQKKTQQNLQQQQKSQKNNMNWLIKKYEGCQLKAYRCPAGIWTIGWGSTNRPDGTPIKEGDVIDQATADAWLENYIRNYIWPHIKDLKLTDNQRDAVESLIYNIGWGAFSKSKCYKAIKEKDWGVAFNNWNWISGGGKTLNGLIKRRAEEKFLFFLDI